MTPEEWDEKKRQLLARTDPSQRLAMEFHFALSAFEDSLLRKDTPRTCRCQESPADPQVEFCRTYLDRLNEQEQACRLAGEDPKPVLLARIAVRRQLASRAERKMLWAEAEEHLHHAYQDAMSVGCRTEIFGLLMHLGALHQIAYLYDPEFEHLLDRAEYFYKEAVPNADRTGKMPDLLRVFEGLGQVYRLRQATLPQSVLMYDLASRFGPLGYSALKQKQGCRLDLGERKALHAELKVADGASCYDFASALAAAEVLKRHKFKAELLERAVAAALQHEEHVWLDWFVRFRKDEAAETSSSSGPQVSTPSRSPTMTPEELDEAKYRGDAEADQFAELIIEFHDGLTAIREDLAQNPGPRGWEKRRFREENACIDHCRTFLAKLDKRELSTREAGENPAPIRLARVSVRLEFAPITIRGERWSEAEEQLTIAYQDARISGDRHSVFGVLKMLGHLYKHAHLCNPEAVHLLENAAHYFKEALPYAGLLGRYPEALDVFYWLGIIYSKREETLPQAVLMFDLASRYGYLGYTSLVEKQRCRLLLGERKALLAELKVTDDAGGQEFASALAAAQALKRRKQKAELLERAIEVARRSGETDWLDHFERLRKYDTGEFGFATTP